MPGTGLSSCPALLGVVGLILDFGDPSASGKADFGDPEEGLSGAEVFSGPENLLIRSLMLPERRRFELDRTADGF